MKNTFLILIFTALTFSGYSQVKKEESKLRESAIFKIKKQDLSAQSIVIHSNNTSKLFTGERLIKVKNNLYSKEDGGIFYAEPLDDYTSLKVYYLSHVDIQTILDFIYPVNADIYYDKPSDYIIE